MASNRSGASRLAAVGIGWLLRPGIGPQTAYEHVYFLAEAAQDFEREVGTNPQRKTGRGLFKHPCRKARARAVGLAHDENLKIPAI